MAISIGIIILLHFVVILLNRNKATVRARSFLFQSFTLLGNLILTIWPVFFIMRPTRVSCSLKTVVGVLGFGMVHTALLGREVLLFHVFNASKRLRVRKGVSFMLLPTIVCAFVMTCECVNINISFKMVLFDCIY
jgi:hypothetical protein